MDLKTTLVRFIRIFAISLLVTLGVTFLWDLIFHGVAKVDWETSFRFAILLGILLPIAASRKNQG
jgi:hypothetical protein